MMAAPASISPADANGAASQQDHQCPENDGESKTKETRKEFARNG